MKLRKQGHCVYKCEYHLVIVTKYRRKIFNEGTFRYFCEVMKGVIYDGIWSDGYFVSTVGLNEEVIRKYIERQGEEDRGQAQLVLE